MAARTSTAAMTPAPGRPDVLIPAVGQCSGAALRKAARRVSLIYDAVLAPAGLRSTQLSLLIHVARRGEPTLGELASHLELDRSALPDNLRPMMRDGLIVVRPCEIDRRGRRVSLTEAGYAKLSEATALWSTAQQRFEAALRADEALALSRALDRITGDGFLAAFAEALVRP